MQGCPGKHFPFAGFAQLFISLPGQILGLLADC